ncbi:glycerol-3-phosphate dehydrogenase (NAD(+)) [Cryptococcus neoformans]|uniref:Glycerol-3-phosphate dehydrogenase [NAD(+)] n=2 Tax=Cryptococcus neoformans TaxID=5207 RepID=A0A854QPV2_CRYNE|nr:glycerol-3-phosphate dehydrogenase (NAD()) [Cryptococcus neoformans var. grubii H99]AUB21665.1 glycerol-3-phosphate dehydrogenase (NAD()) [Cryptococcus neoformans var. grubii]OWZ37500.1 glycerol-3-phosphate dehydrogenase (NAD(+)) [Cryptococcus neoformans var. grubii AD2-60a]OWZ48673.1 glycerol-3-phosphate dehydrogenase (NAD(+)) [Cryptococcus neoformans var. grubii C23]OWZ59194.1 glycerol-3-phosphate dehydrogenase (NAD(+)) [Cryptococcus neoformans var. grubii 125.91]OWZ59204.1 glycerol-3-pho|eukprot:XP_012046543.1 glycerol-3-phosphate dehydrogenase (NAD()) [Cryptococcus neoformans var. grubii H99]
MGKEKVAVVGSGNWGSAISRLAGMNTKKHSDVFDDSRVSVWVYEEEFEGKKLTEIINSEHENRKYLPGVKFEDNVVAIPDLKEAVKDATALVFVTPHQFLGKVLDTLEGNVRKDAKAITLIKGIDVHGDDIHIFADLIEQRLGIPCSALSGANIANEVARDTFSETTIGYRNKEDGELWLKLFQTPKFKVQLIDDVAGVSLCGALKNIVAVAAGFIDGLGYGSNSKAAIMRIGLIEMKHFCQEFFVDVKEESFLQESAGVSDVITSCLSGRNYKVAAAFVGANKSFDQLEAEMLNGQKLQGIHTAKDVHNFLNAKNRSRAYPLFDKVYQIAWEGVPVEKLTEGL